MLLHSFEQLHIGRVESERKAVLATDLDPSLTVFQRIVAFDSLESVKKDYASRWCQVI